MKEKIKEFYYRNGPGMGKSMLISCCIAAVILFGIPLLTGGKFSVDAIMELVIAIPLFSLVILLVRIVSNVLGKIFPGMSGIGKGVVLVLLFFLAVTGIGYVAQKIPGAGNSASSNIPQIIITVIFDVGYIASMVVLLMAGYRNKKNKGNDENVESSC